MLILGCGMKVDLQLESGEYFLAQEAKAERTQQAQQQKQAEEAQLLRERALEALNASAAKQPAAEGDGASDDLPRKPGEKSALVHYM